MNIHQLNISYILEKRIGFWKEFFLCLALALAARGSMVFQLNFSVEEYAGLNMLIGQDFRIALQEMRLFSYFINCRF